MDFLDFHIFYPIKYESKAPTIWLPLNILGYYCSEFFFLLLGLIGFLYVLYKIIKNHSLGIFRKNKYSVSFVLPFLLLTFFMVKDFDDGTDLVLFLPIISILAAISLKKIHVRLTKIISHKTATIFLILIICVYGFFPALQSVYPENPIIRDRDEYVGKVSPLELISIIQKKFGIVNSFLLFLFHRKGEQITIGQQLELAKIIQNNTDEDENIISLGPPEILFLSNRRNLNPYPLFVRDIYKIASDRGDIDKTRGEIIEYKPKFILANGKYFIEKLELTEFVEKNYEKIPFIYYDVYKLSVNP
jgi:hypothetical protein